jgi:hypothetical protein
MISDRMIQHHLELIHEFNFEFVESTNRKEQGKRLTKKEYEGKNQDEK